MERQRVREPDADERDLVARAQRSDVDAFETLYRRYVDRVHGFAFRRSGSTEVAEDVTSATFERALRVLSSFRWRDGGFGPWLFRLAANELAEHHRRETRQRRPRAAVLLAPSPTHVEDGVLSELDAARVRAALDRVNPRYQRVISLRYLSGLGHAEASEAMGTTRAMTAVLLHRAIGALKRELAREGGVA